MIDSHCHLNFKKLSLTDRIYPLSKNYIDIAGAGDSLLVLSSLALALETSIWEAALLGMIASALQVNQVGNLPINLSDLRKYYYNSKALIGIGEKASTYTNNLPKCILKDNNKYYYIETHI